MKLISIVTPCYNEEENVDDLYQCIRHEFEKLPNYDYEHLFIDNASTDATIEKIKKLIRNDSKVKLIVNQRNFGHIRSPIHGILQAIGDAVILMASDLQDPPQLIPEFIKNWENGFKVTIGVKPTSRETWLMKMVRSSYYKTIGRISEVQMIPDYTGFGLYDREVIEQLRALDDPYPYFRGLIAEFGYQYASVPFEQPRRIRGITKNNFYTLYDMAMLGLTSHSKVPIRLAAMAGFILSALSLLVAFIYLLAKLLFWENFSLGVAPMVIGVFFFASVQLFFVGIIGEYIASIHTKIMHRPMVVEKERHNFGNDQSRSRDMAKTGNSPYC